MLHVISLGACMRVESEGLHGRLVGQATGLGLVASTSHAELIATWAVTRAITEYFVPMTAPCTVQPVQFLLFFIHIILPGYQV